MQRACKEFTKSFCEDLEQFPPKSTEVRAEHEPPHLEGAKTRDDEEEAHHVQREGKAIHRLTHPRQLDGHRAHLEAKRTKVSQNGRSMQNHGSAIDADTDVLKKRCRSCHAFMATWDRGTAGALGRLLPPTKEAMAPSWPKRAPTKSASKGSKAGPQLPGIPKP